MPFPIFNFFSGQFRASGNSTPGLSEAEKLLGSGKKRSRLPPQGMVFRADTKKSISGTGDASRGLCLSTFKKNLHLWKPGAY